MNTAYARWPMVLTPAIRREWAAYEAAGDRARETYHALRHGRES